MRRNRFTFVAAIAAAAALPALPARGADRSAATTAQATQQVGKGGDPALRLVVWAAVEDARKTGGTAQDVLDAVTQATAWWQSAQPSVTSEDWLFLDVARVAAREVIQSGGSLSDLFTA